MGGIEWAARSIEQMAAWADRVAKRADAFAWLNRTSLMLERLSFATVCLCVVATLAVVFAAMSTASLWQDELATVMFFSSQGPWHTVTTYASGSNNHIFFNLLNALTPKTDPFDPLQARFWSFASVAACATFLGVFFARRGFYLEGAIGLALLFLSIPLVELSGQARGYGLAGLAATATCIALVKYNERPALAPILVVGVATVLGSYSLLTYLALGFSALGVAFVFSRDYRWVVVGAAAFIVLVGLHAAVIDDIYRTSIGWAAKWGAPYATINATTQTVSQYFLIGASDQLLFFLFSALALGAMIAEDTAHTRAARMLLATSLLFLAGCLVMKTTTVRAAFFVAYPLTVCMLLLVSQLRRFAAVRLLLPLMAVLVGFVASNKSYGQIDRFEYLPRDNWKGAAEYIESSLPPGTPVYVNQRAHNLRAYLSEDFPIVNSFDAGQFSKGLMVVVDFALKPEDRFDTTQLGSAWKETSIPQLRNSRIIIYLTAGCCGVDDHSTPTKPGVTPPNIP
ncbi:hypothetical protein [Pseudomarimonas arenosa]|uniref:Glycosyltransferase RgtA/B/C/D-like domain-containing protein n=1 Tax=Pseudomarimonas arenosa TaxID=2774145 RepID=A0AAW3ZI20_9GAMM|nr:hypothetical protein [Pseudomarimonas arenosa]MBD8524889.1 hypothetical protein [Pseudomarimonas arenosa]